MTSLQCYKCSQAKVIDGRPEIGSMIEFVDQYTREPECELIGNEHTVSTVTCPSNGHYYCGYVHAYVITYVHKGNTI